MFSSLSPSRRIRIGSKQVDLTKQGDVFMEKQKAKLLYKKRIADNKKLGLDVISDSLQNKLMDSDQISFWKIRRKKF